MDEFKICPQCKNYMQAIDTENTLVDTCLNCWGVFFDFGEMKTLIDTIDIPLESSQSIVRGDDLADHINEPYVCPKCQDIMTEKEYLYDSWIHIDFCQKCYGVYLNKWEFDEIDKYVNSLENTTEWRNHIIQGEKLGYEADKIAKEKIDLIKKEIDDLYKTDNILGLNHVVDFVVDKFVL